MIFAGKGLYVTESTRTLETLEMVGGALCLDFVNTINSRINPEHDYLTTHDDLAAWAAKAGIPTSPGPDANTGATLKRALHLRDLLHRIFSSLARHTDPTPAALAAFTAVYAHAVSHSQFVRQGDHFALNWLSDAPDSILWPIAYSAGDLLFSDALLRLKECPSCGWLFLDTSKNQSRRWCSMNTCGARSKMRRYNTRHRTD